MGQIKDLYNDLAKNRSQFEMDAARNANYYMDIGNPQTNASGSESSVAADRYQCTDMGKEAVMTMASTINELAFPAKVDWSRLDVMPKLLARDDKPQNSQLVARRQKLEQSRTDQESILAEGTRAMMSLFETYRARSAYITAEQHKLMDGQVVINWQPKDNDGPERIKLFPLKQFAFQWMGNRIVRVIVWESTGKKDADGNDIRLYTEIDYIKDKVFQERDGEDSDSKKEIKDSPKLWIPYYWRQPRAGQSYCEAYCTLFINTMTRLNGLCRASQDIVGICATMIGCVRPSSGLSTDDMKNLTGPNWIELNNPNDVFILQHATQKLGDLQAVYAEIDRIETKIRENFLYGVRGRDPQQEMTATEVRKIIAEIESVRHGIFTSVNDHLQKPTAEALMHLAGIIKTMPDTEFEITPVITTGVAALTSQEAGESLIYIIKSIGEVAPEFLQRIPMGKVFQRLSNSARIDTSDLNPESLQALDLAKMLVAKAQEDPTVIPTIMELVGQFLQDSEKTVEKQEQGAGFLKRIFNNFTGGAQSAA